MIVAGCFDGDSDEEVMWLQHDVFSQSVGIIAGRCQQHTRLAHRILGDRWDEWNPVDSFDSRTLSFAHDSIAAAWRYRSLPELRQLRLPVLDLTSERPDFVSHWLNWLRDELDSWWNHPELVRPVAQILGNQNEDIGFRAEADLNWELMLHYYDVPWKHSRTDAAWADLEADRAAQDMVSTPDKLLAHLRDHPQTTRGLVAALADDIVEATDQIMDILDRGYLSTHWMFELMEWKSGRRDYIAGPNIEAGTDWFLPLSDEFDWDQTTELINKLVGSDDLVSDFRHRLIIEFMMQIEVSGRTDLDTPYMDIFGSKALEALDTKDIENDDIDEGGLIRSAVPLIAAWMRETIKANGEHVVLNAAERLVPNKTGS